MNAELLPIGNELLSGRIVDTNSSYMARALAGIGIRVRWVTMVGDEEAEIFSALQRAWNRADVVIATGGLGPTDDDITRHAIAKVFGVPLELRQELLEPLRAFFARINRPFSKTNEIQAWMPCGAKVIANPAGTAPGICMERDGKVFFSLPGVPREMKVMMQETVLPALRTIGKGQVILERALRTAGIGESSLFALLEKRLQPGPVRIGYLPEVQGVTITLAVGPMEPSMAVQELDRVEATIRQLAGAHIFGRDGDTLASVVGQLLQKKRKTLAVAESCTGGLLGGMITEISGSSAYFEGGWITYSNRAKSMKLGVDPMILSQHGAVSRETAESMARGAREGAGSDFALAITGIAGPTGGTPEKPVGTVWIALATKDRVFSEMNVFLGNRSEVRSRAANRALFILWNELRA